MLFNLSDVLNKYHLAKEGLLLSLYCFKGHLQALEAQMALFKLIQLTFRSIHIDLID